MDLKSIPVKQYPVYLRKKGLKLCKGRLDFRHQTLCKADPSAIRGHASARVGSFALYCKIPSALKLRYPASCFTRREPGLRYAG